MSRLSQLAINEEGFVFDPFTGESFTVNKTGSLIIEALRMKKEAEEIIGELISEFEVDSATAQRDVSDFISHLRTLKII